MDASVGKRKGIYLKTLQWLKYFSKNSGSFYIPLFTHPESEFASSLTHVSLLAKAPVKKLDLKKGKSKSVNKLLIPLFFYFVLVLSCDRSTWAKDH